MGSITEQLRRHSVALISLIVALTSLAYNTWRNERTEANRNVRTAGIEFLLKLGELDRVVFFSQYEMDSERGNPNEGWAYVLTARDLADLTSEPAIGSAHELFETWDNRFDELGSPDRSAANAISDAIDAARGDMLSVLADLD